MLGWRKNADKSRCGNNSVKQKPTPLQTLIMKARDIVERCQSRSAKGLHLLPRHLSGRQDTPELILEQRDAMKLCEWKGAAISLEARRSRALCNESADMPLELKAYLDNALPCWQRIDAESPYAYNAYPLSNNVEEDNNREALCQLYSLPDYDSEAVTTVPTFSDVNGIITDRPLLVRSIAPEHASNNDYEAISSLNHSNSQFFSISNKSVDELDEEKAGVEALLQLSNSEYSSNTGSSSPTSDYFSNDSERSNSPKSSLGKHHLGYVASALSGKKRKQSTWQY